LAAARVCLTQIFAEVPAASVTVHALATPVEPPVASEHTSFLVVSITFKSAIPQHPPKTLGAKYKVNVPVLSIYVFAKAALVPAAENGTQTFFVTVEPAAGFFTKHTLVAAVLELLEHT